jgi:biotin carboxyl carrier protein
LLFSADRIIKKKDSPCHFVHSYNRLRVKNLQKAMSFLPLLVVALVALTRKADAFGVHHDLNLAARTPFSSKSALYAISTKITMPALSSTMKEGRVVTWLKNEGDEIEAGEAIMVVESDKADMDVEAFEDGFLAKIIVGEGEMAPVGEALALICETQADIASVLAAYATNGATPPATAVAETTAAAAATPASGTCLELYIGPKKSLPWRCSLLDLIA